MFGNDVKIVHSFILIFQNYLTERSSYRASLMLLLTNQVYPNLCQLLCRLTIFAFLNGLGVAYCSEIGLAFADAFPGN